ncbi:ABC transporter ATP-binding protein [Zavarzinia sp. CC-PAN008]|uniref:ABC transporter ATP-binding protein n=1 Tax=Zavarzinia sp. CC-PAN008 TaxID=3243332 RepID=UPI003F744BD0
MRVIAVEDLVVEFGHGPGAVRAVDRVSFDVQKGEVYGLVGESGSGKSTVLRAIAGLVTPQAGRITVAGHVLGRRRSHEDRRTLQMVFQDPFGSLHPRHTVDRTLREPIAVHRLDQADARIVEALRAVGLGPQFRFRYPHQLSGGQRQRVALARALILEPPVLLLDEPTSALDVSVQAEILNLLAEIVAARQITAILVSHNLAVIAHLCRNLAVMTQGRIVERLDSAALRAGRAEHPYTQRLLSAAHGYDRAAALRLASDVA